AGPDRQPPRRRRRSPPRTYPQNGRSGGRRLLFRLRREPVLPLVSGGVPERRVAAKRPDVVPISVDMGGAGRRLTSGSRLGLTAAAGPVLVYTPGAFRRPWWPTCHFGLPLFRPPTAAALTIHLPSSRVPSAHGSGSAGPSLSRRAPASRAPRATRRSSSPTSNRSSAPLRASPSPRAWGARSAWPTPISSRRIG